MTASGPAGNTEVQDPVEPGAESENGGTQAGEAQAEAQAGAPVEAARSSGSLDRMTRLRHLVRTEGKTAEEAAQEIGIDPIIAQLWLRLPDDLWPEGRLSNASGASGGAEGGAAPAAPAAGLRRVITCRVPGPAYDRLRNAEAPLLEAAATALETGLTLPRPERAAGAWRYTRRPLAVPVTAASFEAIAALAADAFDGDMRDAAGWLIARGIGMAIPLPATDDLTGNVPDRAAASTSQVVAPPPPAARFVVPPRRRPEQRAPLPPDDSAPNGDELRQRREAVGISQRDLAAASGLSRGLVAEVERGRRRHVLTRLRISETLASLERSK